MVAVEDHVHALKHEALVVVLERQDALAAQDVGPSFCTRSCTQGKNLSGSSGLSVLSDSDCMSSS